MWSGRDERVQRLVAATKNERRAIASQSGKRTSLFTWGRSDGRFPLRGGGALIRHHGTHILNSLDTTLTRPVTTTPSTKNAPIVERARLRRLVARRREGAFPDWLTVKGVYRDTRPSKE